MREGTKNCSWLDAFDMGGTVRVLGFYVAGRNTRVDMELYSKWD